MEDAPLLKQKTFTARKRRDELGTRSESSISRLRGNKVSSVYSALCRGPTTADDLDDNYMLCGPGSFHPALACQYRRSVDDDHVTKESV